MRLTVVIPTYNRLDQTIEAVSSVLAQRATDLELEVIVVDDGSNDGSKARLEQFYRDGAVRVIANRRTKGPAGARNTGIADATGDYIALLDSDDVFLADHLQASLLVFLQHPDVGAVFGSALYEQDGQAVPYMGPNFERKQALAPGNRFEGGITVMDKGFFDHLLRHGCYFNLSTVVLRANAAREWMNESLQIAEDYEFWVRLSRKFAFACISKPQIKYQLHGTNLSFESASSAEENGPSLLSAYEIMGRYSGLDRSQRRTIEHNIADELFCWAYRCQRQRRWAEAARLYQRSYRHGMRAKSVLAMVKLGCRRLIPRAVARP